MSFHEYLPQSQGLLPKWMAFISAVSLFNSLQCYIVGEKLNRRVYENKPEQVTGLASRTFGTWTILTSLVRLYACYNINDPKFYDLALWSYLVAGFHFLTEWQVYKTARWGKGLAGPVIVFTTTTIWMVLQKDYYVN